MTDGLLGDCKPDPLVRGHISDPVIDAVKEAVAARSRDSAEQDAAKIDATLAAALELKYAGKILAHAAARANEATNARRAVRGLHSVVRGAINA